MQKPIIKQLGKQMREKFALLEDLPAPFRKALQQLANAERACREPPDDPIGQS